MGPLWEKRLEAQHHVEQQGHPDMPTHGIGAVTEEVAQLLRPAGPIFYRRMFRRRAATLHQLHESGLAFTPFPPCHQH